MKLFSCDIKSVIKNYGIVGREEKTTSKKIQNKEFIPLSNSV